MSPRFEDLADRLDAISEEIADAAIDELRDALRRGAGRPPVEKQLTQARRAVEKAIRLLRAAGGDPAEVDEVDDSGE